MNDLKQLITLLIENHLDFVIIGGVAASLYGSSQVTYDVDVLMRMDPTSLENLRTCLAPHHPVHRMTPQKLSFLENPQSFSGIKNLYLQTDLGVLDVLGDMPGTGSFDEIFSRANTTTLNGKTVKIISLDDLIDAKTRLGRHKDKVAVTELNYIKKKQKPAD